MPSLAATSIDVPSFAHNHRHWLVGKGKWVLRASDNPSAGIRNMKMQPNQTVATPMQADQWVQDERELKRQKRKQSNRESATRSRLRKQLIVRASSTIEALNTRIIHIDMSSETFLMNAKLTS
ncbi:G-box-binding factor 1-like protein isoform X1 [Tanacetum coccineum]